MAVTEHPQTAIDEKLIANDELEKALEARENAKAQASAVAKRYRDLDSAAKVMLEEFQLADGEVARCGRFRIHKARVAPRSVSFETAATSRLRIRCDNDEGE